METEDDEVGVEEDGDVFSYGGDPNGRECDMTTQQATISI
jgi:hypothetical protein